MEWDFVWIEFCYDCCNLVMMQLMRVELESITIVPNWNKNICFEGLKV